MSADTHENVLPLLAASLAGDIKPAEAEWLKDHLANCGRCSAEADAWARAVRVYRGVSVMAPPALVARTRRLVGQRAEAFHSERFRMFPLWMAVMLSTACISVTAPYAWRIFGWVGRATHLRDEVWQFAFLYWWFLPATILAAILAWRYQNSAGTPFGEKEKGELS